MEKDFFPSLPANLTLALRHLIVIFMAIQFVRFNQEKEEEEETEDDKTEDEKEEEEEEEEDANEDQEEKEALSSSHYNRATN